MSRSGPRLVRRVLFHGGHLDQPPHRLWLSPSRLYAQGWAQFYESPLWEITIEMKPKELLDLSEFEDDAAAVARTLTEVGLPVRVVPQFHSAPQTLLRQLTDAKIRKAGFRAIQLQETTNWSHEATVIRRALSVCLVDPSAIVSRIETWQIDLNMHQP